MFQSIASSSTGQYVVVGGTTGCYVSSSYGLDWSSTQLYGNWIDIAISSSGQYMSIANSMGLLYVSTSYGQKWSETTLNEYETVAISSNAQYFYASSADYSYTSNVVLSYSTTFGSLWKQLPYEYHDYIIKVIATSSDGQNIVAVFEYAYVNQSIQASFNYGLNWTQLNAPSIVYPYNTWTALSLDATGHFLTASQYNGSIYTLVVPVPPTSSPTQTPTYTVGNPTPIPSQTPTLSPTPIPSQTPTPRPTPTPSWVKSNAPNTEWSSISNNGQIMYASSSSNNGLYISTDYGSSWSSRLSLTYPGIIVSGLNGKVVVSCGSSVLVSSDYGDTFKNTISNGCSSVALSSNSSYIIYGGSTFNFTLMSFPLYVSSNYGTNFTLTSAISDGPWVSIVSSSNGSIIFALSQPMIFVSTNYGITFKAIYNPPSCNSLSCDALCTIILCNVQSGYIYSSNDTGMTWVQTNSPYGYWGNIAISASGKYAAAIAQNVSSPPNYFFSISESYDYGNTWIMSSAPTMPISSQWRVIFILTFSIIQQHSHPYRQL